MAIRRPPTTFSDTISTADIADDAITGGKLANDIAISTTGNIATTGSGTLTVAGASNFGSIASGTIASAVNFPFDGTTDAGRIIQVKGLSSRESNQLVGAWTVRWNYSIVLKSSSSRIWVLHTENSYVSAGGGYGVKVYRNSSVYNDSVTTTAGTVVYDKVPLNSSGLSHMVYSHDGAMYTINPINFVDDVSSSFNAGDTVYYGHYYSEYVGTAEVPAAGNGSDHGSFNTMIIELAK